MYQAICGNFSANGDTKEDAATAVLELAVPKILGEWGQKLISCKLKSTFYVNPSCPNIRSTAPRDGVMQAEEYNARLSFSAKHGDVVEQQIDFIVFPIQ